MVVTVALVNEQHELVRIDNIVFLLKALEKHLMKR